ncbi:Uncharacterised protein [Mycobacteroides abscessus subsp. abscessus]|nr:Uncharacterised protein [Mycobacteroides abscessus subsp. abscessus]SIN59428.1 Uncharacterised protein [Mycobacteroides abscessus subsp. abscessus]
MEPARTGIQMAGGGQREGIARALDAEHVTDADPVVQLNRSPITVRYAPHRNSVVKPIARIATERVLPDGTRRQRHIQVRARPPSW